MSWTQQPQKHDIPLQNTIFLAFCKRMYDLCGSWVRLMSHTNKIFHSKTLKQWCFAMEYRVCVALESNSLPTQIVYYIAKRYKNGVLQWSIVCVWLLSITHYPHKSYIPWQNAKQNGVLWWNSCLCGSWLLHITHTNRIFHCKTIKKRCFAMKYRVCVTLESYSLSSQIVYSIANR